MRNHRQTIRKPTETLHRNQSIELARLSANDYLKKPYALRSWWATLIGHFRFRTWSLGVLSLVAGNNLRLLFPLPLCPLTCALHKFGELQNFQSIFCKYINKQSKSSSPLSHSFGRLNEREMPKLQPTASPNPVARSLASKVRVNLRARVKVKWKIDRQLNDW